MSLRSYFAVHLTEVRIRLTAFLYHLERRRLLREKEIRRQALWDAVDASLTR